MTQAESLRELLDKEENAVEWVKTGLPSTTRCLQIIGVVLLVVANVIGCKNLAKLRDAEAQRGQLVIIRTQEFEMVKAMNARQIQMQDSQTIWHYQGVNRTQARDQAVADLSRKTDTIKHAVYPDVILNKSSKK